MKHVEDLVVKDHVVDYQVLMERDPMVMNRAVLRHLALGYSLYGSPGAGRQVMIKLAPPGTPIMRPGPPHKK